MSNPEIQERQSNPKMDAYIEDLKAVILRHYADLTPEALLAGMASMVGRLAMTQAPHMSPAMTHEVIVRNIEIGSDIAVKAQLLAAGKAQGRG